MWKKSLPTIALSALLLGACSMSNDRALPDNNETPMEDIDDRERERNWTPNVEDERRGGADLDGIETEEPRDDEGIMNNDRDMDDNRVPRHNGKGDSDLE